MSGNEPIKYVTFGGALVPENCRRETTTRKENGETIYCVWTQNGAKVEYPEQRGNIPTHKSYHKEVKTKPHGIFYSGASHETTEISKETFETEWTSKHPHYERYRDRKSDDRIIEHKHANAITTTTYKEVQEYAIPRITIQENNNNNNITLYGICLADVTGSQGNDNIILDKTDLCKVTVNNDDNTSSKDSVTVVSDGERYAFVYSGANDNVTLLEPDGETVKTTHSGNGYAF